MPECEILTVIVYDIGTAITVVEEYSTLGPPQMFNIVSVLLGCGKSVLIKALYVA